jgi:hypothetical protein
MQVVGEQAASTKEAEKINACLYTFPRITTVSFSFDMIRISSYV